jgi:hypothetical protein
LLTNRHSPHSLTSVKDMYVEMGFLLNLHQQQISLPYKALHQQLTGNLPVARAC